MSSQEEALFARALELTQGDASGHAAVLCDLSGLAQIDDPVLSRTVNEILDEQIRALPHDAFALANHRWMLVAERAIARDIEARIEDLSRFLVSHHRGAIRQTRFDLRTQGAHFRALCRHMMADRAETAPPAPARTQSDTLTDLDRLMAIEGQLRGADLSPFLRNRTVWRVVADRPAAPEAEEIVPDLDALGRLTRQDVTGRPWLEDHVRELLERHILTHLAREFRAMPGHPRPRLVAIRRTAFDAADMPVQLHNLGVVALVDVADAADLALVEALAVSGGFDVALRAEGKDPAALAGAGSRVRYILAPGAMIDGALTALDPKRLVVIDPDEAAFAKALDAGVALFQGTQVPALARARGGVAVEAPVETKRPARTIEDEASVEAPEAAPAPSGLLGRLFGRRAAKTEPGP